MHRRDRMSPPAGERTPRYQPRHAAPRRYAPRHLAGAAA